MTAGDIASKDVAVAHRDEPVVAAARRMRDLHVGDLVVVDESAGGGIPIGIVTDRDLVVKILADGGERAARASVADAMSTDLVTARCDDSVEDALVQMTASGVRRLPLVDDSGRLAGVLAFDDVVALLSEELVDLARLIARQQRRERLTRHSVG
jgi:CBS domain-containing protein